MKNKLIIISILILIMFFLFNCSKKKKNSKPDIKPEIEKKEAEIIENKIKDIEIINMYYDFLINNDLEKAYDISSKKVEYEKFHSWYKDVSNITLNNIHRQLDGKYSFIVELEEESENNEINKYKFYVIITVDSENQKISESKSEKLNDQIIDVQYTPYFYYNSFTIYSDPDTESREKVTTIPPNNKIYITENKFVTKGESKYLWHKIIWNEYEGWIEDEVITPLYRINNTVKYSLFLKKNLNKEWTELTFHENELVIYRAVNNEPSRITIINSPEDPSLYCIYYNHSWFPEYLYILNIEHDFSESKYIIDTVSYCQYTDKYQRIYYYDEYDDYSSGFDFVSYNEYTDIKSEYDIFHKNNVYNEYEPRSFVHEKNKNFFNEVDDVNNQ